MQTLGLLKGIDAARCPPSFTVGVRYTAFGQRHERERVVVAVASIATGSGAAEFGGGIEMLSNKVMLLA